MPTDRQRTHFARAAGTARFAYNWALARWQELYQARKLDASKPSPNEMLLRRELNAIKREQFPWMLEVTKCAPQLAIKQLGVAYKNFFAGTARYPSRRRKGVHDRFSLSNDLVALDTEGGVNRIRVPKLGWVRMREALRIPGKVLSATISLKAGRWFVSFNVESSEVRPQVPRENQAAVGVDLGLTHLAVLSTGEKVKGPKALKQLLGKLKRLSRSLSRKQKGSANRRKAKVRLARLHARIGNVRADALHKLTSRLATGWRTVVVEDLHVKGMVRNRHLARSLSDAAFGELRRQLTYKCELYGSTLVVADKWFPSSKLCSGCGVKHEALTLATRRWTCAGCGAVHDRDINAAVNLKNLISRRHESRLLAVSSTVSAPEGVVLRPPGETSSGHRLAAVAKLVSVKGEGSSKPAMSRFA